MRDKLRIAIVIFVMLAIAAFLFGVGYLTGSETARRSIVDATLTLLTNSDTIRLMDDEGQVGSFTLDDKVTLTIRRRRK